MREYARISPAFWTRGSGKHLRGHPEAQVMAMYLFSAPSSNMILLYYQPWSAVLTETGLTDEGASKGLQRVSEQNIAFFDEDFELVFLPEGAHYQTAERMKKSDNRVRGVHNQLLNFRKHYPRHCFYNQFVERYNKPYNLNLTPDPAATEQGALKGLRSQRQRQRQEQEQRHLFSGEAGAPGLGGGADEILAILESHPSLASIASLAVAESLTTWIVQGGRTIEQLAEPIAFVAAAVGTETAAGDGAAPKPKTIASRLNSTIASWEGAKRVRLRGGNGARGVPRVQPSLESGYYDRQKPGCTLPEPQDPPSDALFADEEDPKIAHAR